MNTWDVLEDDPELLHRDAATLKRFLARRGYGEDLRISSRDLAQIRVLRDSLRAAFTAGDEEAAVRKLNGVLRRSTAKPQFGRGRAGVACQLGRAAC